VILLRSGHASRIVKLVTPRKLVSIVAFALSCALVGPLLGAGNELYGKPLRGLTPVAIAELKQAPDRYRQKVVRVVGTAGAGSPSEVTLSEGGASLAVRTDGSFSLPAKLDGARVTAEGKLRDGALVATGVEVSR
jgi:hypothetical protein